MFSLAGFARAMATDTVDIGGCSVVIRGLSAREVAAVESAIVTAIDRAAARKATGTSNQAADASNLTLMAARVVAAGQMCDPAVNGGKPWGVGDDPAALFELAAKLLGLVTAQELQGAFIKLMGLEAGPSTAAARKAKDRATAAAVLGELIDDGMYAAGRGPLAQAVEAIARDAAAEHGGGPSSEQAAAAREAIKRAIGHLRIALADPTGAALGRAEQAGLVGN
jgi:hypothetical protein